MLFQLEPGLLSLRHSTKAGQGSPGGEDTGGAGGDDWAGKPDGSNASTLLAVLVMHVVDGVPCDALGPPTAATSTATTSTASSQTSHDDEDYWKGDRAAWAANAPATLSVAVVEVPATGALGIFPRGGVADQSAAAGLAAAAGAYLPFELGVDAVIFPLPAGAPSPFMKAALAERGRVNGGG